MSFPSGKRSSSTSSASCLFRRPPSEYLPRQREFHEIWSLPIKETALVQLGGLPALHRDPFDRMLVAQALEHDMAIVTVDAAVKAYSVKLLPAE